MQKPSDAYNQAVASPIYRLSELMFGSLLASYVLGFVGFAAGKIASHPSDYAIPAAGSWEFLQHMLTLFVGLLPYLFVSLTYAYATAGLYLSYHTGILLMDHWPFKSLRLDFALALSQAFFLGVSTKGRAEPGGR